jgi:hypothetical protein
MRKLRSTSARLRLAATLGSASVLSLLSAPSSTRRSVSLVVFALAKPTPFEALIGRGHYEKAMCSESMI